jgi:hypothetical protein
MVVVLKHGLYIGRVFSPTKKQASYSYGKVNKLEEL